MDLQEKFKNDPGRKKLLQQILDTHDNAVISHQYDEKENIVVMYDKYSVITIQKLTKQLRMYEQMTYPEIFFNKMKIRYDGICIDDPGDDTDQLHLLEIELNKALENEDFEACEKIQNKINKLNNN